MALKEWTERDSAWWLSWWANDYSWDGLSRKPMLGWVVVNESNLVKSTERGAGSGRPATLQDFFAKFRDKLISSPVSGKQFTPIHLPLFWEDGSPTEKTGWDSKKKAHLVSSAFGPDSYFWAEGAILFTAPDPNNNLIGNFSFCAFIEKFVVKSGMQISANFQRAAFFDGITASGVQFKSPASLNSIHCSGFALFHSTQFHHDIDFDRGYFADNAIFSAARFSGTASFSSVVADSTLEFQRAKFFNSSVIRLSYVGGDISFRNARFSERISKDGTAIDDKLYFDCEECRGTISFQNAVIGQKAYLRVSVHSLANFNGVQFLKGADFRSSEFNGGAIFEEAIFGDELDFVFAKFRDEVSFKKVEFQGPVNFYRALFDRAVLFSDARFKKRANFERVIFRDLVYDGEEEKEGLNRICFRKSEFEDIADFSRVIFSRRCADSSGAFAGTNFQDLVDFTGAGIHWVAALNQAIIGNALILDDLGERISREQFVHFALKMASRYSDLRTNLEGGCRTIKNYYGKARNEAAEQRFHRFQLMARQDRRDIGFFERIVSRSYQVISDFGFSISRPLWMMLATYLFSVITFFATSVISMPSGRPSIVFDLGRPIHEGIIGSLRVSMLNVVKPFEVWRNSTIDKIPWLLSLRQQIGDGWWFVLQVFCSFHSFVSIVLIFLFALALRRRFQIG